MEWESGVVRNMTVDTVEVGSFGIGSYLVQCSGQGLDVAFTADLERDEVPLPGDEIDVHIKWKTRRKSQ